MFCFELLHYYSKCANFIDMQIKEAHHFFKGGEFKLQTLLIYWCMASGLTNDGTPWSGIARLHQLVITHT